MPADVSQDDEATMTADASSPLADLVSPEAIDPMFGESTAIVVAHPDDEVISLGSRLPRLRRATIVHLTDGAPRNAIDARAYGFETPEAYSAARRAELERSLALAGISPDRLEELHCPDQEASLQLVELSVKLAALFRERAITRVITHPYEGGHPDHDATAFAVHAAARLIERYAQRSPDLVEATSYHMGPSGIRSACFLPVDGVASISVSLTPSEQQLKRRMIDAFESQRQTLSYFSTETECFRVAPKYRFDEPAHAGMLFYEKFDWGMTSDRFIELARQAMRALGIESPM